MQNVRVYKNGNHKCMAKRLIQNPPVCISADLRIRWFDRLLYRKNGGFADKICTVCKIYKEKEFMYINVDIIHFNRCFLVVGG
jgi:hypothetical protein